MSWCQILNFSSCCLLQRLNLSSHLFEADNFHLFPLRRPGLNLVIPKLGAASFQQGIWRELRVLPLPRGFRLFFLTHPWDPAILSLRYRPRLSAAHCIKANILPVSLRSEQKPPRCPSLRPINSAPVHRPWTVNWNFLQELVWML